ncbi:MAG TPA: hypothetical protein VK982_16065 [Bacteroidales bacterium]|nr:hypothetical protein [Bacteroidales bacterium]
MRPYNIATIYLLMSIFLFAAACQDSTTGGGSDLTESLEPVEEVSAVEGGESATVMVNKDSKAFFSVEFSEIGANDIIQNGTIEAWCIDWDTYINSDGGIYRDIPLYSTYNVEKWMPVNYLLNIQEALQANDPEITYLEIQLAIWSLRKNPEFDLDEVAIGDLPGRFEKDGQPTFNYEKVGEVLDEVEEGYRAFDFSAVGTKFAVIAKTPPDVQTFFGVVEKQPEF